MDYVIDSYFCYNVYDVEKLFLPPFSEHLNTSHALTKINLHDTGLFSTK